MFWIDFALVLAAIFLGARLGGVALGVVAGLALAILVFAFRLPAGKLPVDVIFIIVAVVTAAATLEAAGGGSTAAIIQGFRPATQQEVGRELTIQGTFDFPPLSNNVTVDGVYGSVGSFNLDYWSYRRNLEVTVSALDQELASSLEQRFREDLALGKEVKLEDWKRRWWWERLLHWLAYKLMRV